MDIKLKSSHKKRAAIGVAAVLIAAVLNLCIFPLIGKKADEIVVARGEDTVYYEAVESLLRGSYILFSEQEEYSGPNQRAVKGVLEEWNSNFDPWRDQVDYYVKGESGSEKNTTRELDALLLGDQIKDRQQEELREQYQCYFTLSYNEEGDLSVEHIWSRQGLEDAIVKSILQAKRMNLFADWEKDYLSRNPQSEDGEGDGSTLSGYGPKNFSVTYGIPQDFNGVVVERDEAGEYYGRMRNYGACGGVLLYNVTLAALGVLLLLLTSNRIWKGTVDYSRRGKWYLMEAAIAGVIFLLLLTENFVQMNISYMDVMEGKMPWQILRSGTLEQMSALLEMGALLAALYGGWYLALAFIRPLFSLGVRKYIREYSLIYCICTQGVSWCRNFWQRTKYEISHVDFSNKTMRTLRKVVILNFLVLAMLSFFWFFGIFALVVYSFALFFMLKSQFDKMHQEYQCLMHATARIAQGDLQYEDMRDWGVFEPFKAELQKIRQGFSKAVEREVKSERMKTELITNVSHDLKTPLTAITTYVELLKDPAITQEQRTAYIEVLERKSLRLRLLVEDLVDVSKATSNTIQLDLMEVDVVNLIKQICVEHENRFEEMGLTLKWKLPEQKTVCMLDNQKTWRIFENLFVNIEKYAMKGSRVFIEVEKKPDGLSVTIKNMSALELNVSGAEITERFVRGDSSRTTEGSGLGLAIAKSFTEAMGGEFEVTVDGDLFKVVILWKNQ